MQQTSGNFNKFEKSDLMSAEGEDQQIFYDPQQQLWVSIQGQ